MSPKTLLEFCQMYNSKHNVLSDELSISAGTFFLPSKFLNRATFIKPDELQEMLDRAFIQILPEIASNFDTYTATQQIDIISSYAKRDIQSGLLDIFINNLNNSSLESCNNLLEDITEFSGLKHVYELINILNYECTHNPDLKSSEAYQNLISSCLEKVITADAIAGGIAK